MRRNRAVPALSCLALLGLAAGCAGTREAPPERADADGQPGATGEAAGAATEQDLPEAARAAPEDAEVWVARLRPLNARVAGAEASGTATLIREGDGLRIVVDAANVPPGMMHLQHYHGFVDGQDARCAGPSADENADGIVDLLETEPVSGTTLVPFHDRPASLEIAAETYPIAGPDGSYRYEGTAAVPELVAALKEKGIDGLALDRRVVYVHGVPEGTELPGSVRSLPGVPAQVTLPIACGELEPVRRP